MASVGPRATELVCGPIQLPHRQGLPTLNSTRDRWEQVASWNIHDAQRWRLNELEGEHYTIMNPMGTGGSHLLCPCPEGPTTCVSLLSITS